MKIVSAQRLVLLFTAGILFGACVAPGVPRQAAFNEADFAASRGTGSGIVGGFAFAVMRDGRKRFAQSAGITLAPVNAYTTEIIKRKFEDGDSLAPPDPRYAKYVRAGNTDEQGNFEFRQIPPGDYYLMGKVHWGLQRGYSLPMKSDETTPAEASTAEDYRLIYARVSVKEGETIKVMDWKQPQ